LAKFISPSRTTTQTTDRHGPKDVGYDQALRIAVARSGKTTGTTA
jgi:hypothetical protein